VIVFTGFWEALAICGGGGAEPPKTPPPRYATVEQTPKGGTIYMLNKKLKSCVNL